MAWVRRVLRGYVRSFSACGDFAWEEGSVGFDLGDQVVGGGIRADRTV